MKRKFIAILLALATVIGLASCSGNAEAPEGMQLVRGGEEVGYYFYAPEEWVAANMGNISATYVSTIDNTSVTFTEANMPEGGDVKAYFEAMKSEFTYENFEVTVDGESCIFAGAEAYKFVYSFKYSDYNFRCMQILAVYGERFYIFTYTATTNDRGDGTSAYDHYLEGKVQTIIDNFKFVDKKEPPKKEYETDADGYILVSDRAVSGFDLFVPAASSPEYDGGIVSVKLGDGANITLARATSTGVYVDQYVKMREEELGAIVTDLEFVEFEDGKNYTPDTVLGNTTQKFAYEYTYEYCGVRYHVYQILAISGTNGYVYTYTATEDAYETYLETVKNIAKKVRF